MRPAEAPSLADLVTRIRVTHHVTTRVLLDELAHAVARIAATAPVADLERVEGLRRAFAYFRDDLLAHLLAEERTVFPYMLALEEAEAGLAPPPHAAFHSIASPVQLMKNEQEATQRALARLEAGIAEARTTGTPSPAWVTLDSLLARLHADLAQHVQIEQTILFPAAVEIEQRLVAARLAAANGPPTRR